MVYSGKRYRKEYTKTDKFILQIGEGTSYYYDPQTYYVDSLMNDPVGRGIYDETFPNYLRNPWQITLEIYSKNWMN